MKLLILQPSNICDMSPHCSYCSFAKYRKGLDRLHRLQTWQNYLEWIDLYTDPNEWMIHFIGGEPSVLPGCDELLDALAARGYWIIFQTHGLNRINPAPRLLRFATWHQQDKFPLYADLVKVLRTGNWEEKIAYCKENNIPYVVNDLLDHSKPSHGRIKDRFPTRSNKHFIKSWTIIHSGEMRPCNRRKTAEERRERLYLQHMKPPDLSYQLCPFCPFIQNFEEVMTPEMKEFCAQYYAKQKEKTQQ